MEPVAMEPIAEGAFGRVFLTTVPDRDEPVVVKVMKFAGTAEPEFRALESMWGHVPVPEPIELLDDPEAIVMSFIPGANGRALADLTGAAAEQAGESVIDLLETLQAIECPVSVDPWAPRFVQEIAPIHAAARSRGFEPVVVEAATKSFEIADQILLTFDGFPVLVHGDFCLGNLLYDEESLAINGLIDPLDSTWGDPVLDLIHLTKSRGHLLRLLERAEARSPMDDDARLRYDFYMFWRWLSYEVRLELGEAEWLKSCAETLLAQV